MQNHFLRKIYIIFILLRKENERRVICFIIAFLYFLLVLLCSLKQLL